MMMETMMIMETMIMEMETMMMETIMRFNLVKSRVRGEWLPRRLKCLKSVLIYEYFNI